jgi:hypothetical protein
MNPFNLPAYPSPVHLQKSKSVTGGCATMRPHPRDLAASMDLVWILHARLRIPGASTVGGVVGALWP